MFKPKYIITDKLLAHVKQVSSLVTQINHQQFPQVVLVEFEKTAKEISSFASTSIEGNPLPLTEVKKILKSTPTHIRDSEKEILNYNQALQYLNLQLKADKVSLSLDLICKIQGQITEHLLPDSESGKLRQKPVVVNDPKSNQIVFLPPDVKDVKPMMKELIDFIEKSKLTVDPLILAGIFHKQMVIIHPFMDGNGRATRLATKVLLAEMGLNTFNLFSFENYYNQNVTKYFQMVGEYGNYYELAGGINFTNWLEYFTEGIIDELLRVKNILPQSAESPETELKEYHQKVIKFIQQNKFIQDSDYARLTKRAKATRALDFQKLIELGMIERMGKGRATYYRLRK